jgi:pyruvate/2-oxoglutarate dehydrogenase complex dihydrolipoamide acyltransferase (E2) component
MDVLMPQLGETVAEGKISKWFVSAGDAVKPGDNLFEIETDKVSMEVPAIAAGVLSAINVAAGETAPVGAVVAVISRPGETTATTPLTPAKAGVQKSEGLGPRFRGDERVNQVTTAKPATPMQPFREVRSPERNYGPARLVGGTTVTPLARRLAGEAGIDLANVKGSGPHGRIVAADIESTKAAVASPASAALAATPIVLTADVAIGRSLALCSEANAAQKTALELADIVIKAWATALSRAMPSEHTGIALAIGKNRTTIAAAAAKSLTAISVARREGAGGSASSAISIPGVAGVTSVADVLKSPQTTLLSLGAPRRAPVEAQDGSVQFVSMMTATLSCDHRAIDATTGAELLSAFKGFVERPVTMIV